MAATCGWPFGDDTNQIRALAQELVGPQRDIMLATSLLATVALQHETRAIPIVFANLSDPVASGIVARLDRPGGNITGFVNMEASLGGKWLELLAVTVPGSGLQYVQSRYGSRTRLHALT
jgi:putative tryptophan/tyrosine transport system substrate-binding protein